MPPLSPVVDSLDKVPEAARQFYEQKDGKYQVILDSAPPGFVSSTELAVANGKVVEFRDKNVALLKEVEELRPIKAKVADLDIDAAKAALASKKELEGKGVKDASSVDAMIKAAVDAANKPLQEQLVQLTTTAAADRKRADDAVLKSTIQEKFTKAGGVPGALDFMVGKASGIFVVESGEVKAAPNKFSSARPGEPLTVEEWLSLQVKESAFAFNPSAGGGANPHQGSGPTLKPGQTVLKDPTPQQLGEHSKDIATGKMKVEYTNA